MNNKIALVTGGSTGIGAAIAARLAEDGFLVTITGRHKDTLKSSAAQHANIDYVIADVSKSDDIKKTFDHIGKMHGRLDLLVNNAGIAPPMPLADITPEHIDQVFGTNVRGLVEVTVQALPFLKKSKGNIINIASVVGDRPAPNMSIYSATKGALITLTLAWAKELAGDGIRVNVVSPGPIETPIFDKMNMDDEQKKGMAESINAMVPLGRFGSAAEVAM